MTRNNEQTTTLTRRNGGVPAPWNPIEELNTLRRQMDDLFSRSFGYTPLSQLIPADGYTFEPPCEIHDLADKIRIFAAVPGFKPEEIKIEATESQVQITGERKALNLDTTPEGGRGWLSRESAFTVYCDLPAEVDAGKSKANVHDGMLTLDLPKTEVVKPKTIKIDVTQK